MADYDTSKETPEGLKKALAAMEEAFLTQEEDFSSFAQVCNHALRYIKFLETFKDTSIQHIADLKKR